jgi:hypothetical protein
MKLNWLFSVLLSLLVFVACSGDETISDEEVSDNEILNEAGNEADHDDPLDYVWDDSDITTLDLEGSSISINGNGASAVGSIATITSAGNYSISGTLTDGQIIVNTNDEGVVRLILNNVTLTCSTNAAIYVEEAEKTLIILSENTLNSISDGSTYTSSEEDANAAIFSKDALTLYGTGSLLVNGNYNDGITSKDGLIIASGTLTVNAVDDGIRGKDYLLIKSGDITINSMGDGLKSDNDDDNTKGYISINDGTLNITSEGDAIQAYTDVLISSGVINLSSGGGSNSYLSDEVSAKGIKSGVSTTISDGTITINAADDGLHTDGDQFINGGTFYVASGDDGFHSEYNTEITKGDIFITEAYEGIESWQGNVSISGGNISIVASDDGINVSAGGASAGGGPHKSTSTSEYALNISGGYLLINCEGDGLDSNDLLAISGGTMLVNSAEYNENSALDYDGTCPVSGGLLVAVGTSLMSEAPSSSSTQYSVLINFSSRLATGSIIHMEDSNGTNILTYETIKSFQSLAFSSSQLTHDTNYKLYIGGSYTGSPVNGLVVDGSYTGGTLITSFTISSIITTKNL